MTDVSSPVEIILAKTRPFYRFDVDTSDEELLAALRQLLEQWSEIILVAKDATEDELFYLHVTRGLLHRIFAFVLVKHGFENDHGLTREIFGLGSNFLLTQLDIFANQNPPTFVVSNVRSIMELLSVLILHLQYTDVDLINEQLLVAMREYLDHDPSNNDLIDGILSFIWCMSDYTSCIPKLVQMGYAESLYQWVEISPKRFRNDQQTALINIFQNMSRHDDAIEQFNRLKILNMIDQLTLSVELSFSLQIIRILVTDVDQIQLESTEFLTQFIAATVSAGENEDYRHEGAHICELLTVLAKLAYNDAILVTMLNSKPSLVEFFASLLIRMYPKLSAKNIPLQNYTCVLLMNILARISYQQDYSSVISTNQDLMNMIENMTKNEIDFIDAFMPRTMKSIEETAYEIRKNFHDQSASISSKVDDTYSRLLELDADVHDDIEETTGDS